MAAFFEGCALAVLLEKVGAEVVVDGWSGSGVDLDGRLCGVTFGPRRAAGGWRRSVLALVVELFAKSAAGSIEDRIRGRGTIRSSLRQLVRNLECRGAPGTPAVCLMSLLEIFPILWQKRFATSRRSLVADSKDGLLIAAPASVARRLAAPGTSSESLKNALEQNGASVWFGSEGMSRRQMADQHRRAGRLVAATRSASDSDPGSGDISLVANLISLGRLRQALRILGPQAPEEEPEAVRLRLVVLRLRAREAEFRRRIGALRKRLDRQGPERRSDSEARIEALCSWAERLREDVLLGELDRSSDDPSPGPRHQAASAVCRARRELLSDQPRRAERSARRAACLMAGGVDSLVLWTARTLLVAARWRRGRHDERDLRTLRLAARFFERRGLLAQWVDVVEVRSDLAEFGRDWAAELAGFAALRRRLDKRSVERLRIDLCEARLRVVGGAGGGIDRRTLRVSSLVSLEQRIEIAASLERSLAEELLGEDAVSVVWRSLLEGRRPRSGEWLQLQCAGSFRAARCIVSMMRNAPALVPPGVSSWAAARLHEGGLASSFIRLGGGAGINCEAVLDFLSARDPMAAVEPLFEASGYADARLEWRVQGEARRLVDGGGGPRRWTEAVGGGSLVLESPVLDDPLKLLVGLVGQRLPGLAIRGAVATDRQIIGNSQALRRALDRLDDLAASDVPILLQGESGTGKELAARRLHERSRRSACPFLAYNCAAINDSLLLGDLFGHKRGAFTGADSDRCGVFETAEGGTVLLDEVADLSEAAQGALLRFLQEGEIRRLGESRPRRVDVRVVAATHHDLGAMVRRKAFRHDLYFRLAAAIVVLPPLRERGEDVVQLSEYILAKHGGTVSLSSGARRRLLDYSWPGNVRELQNRLQVASTLCENRGRLRGRDLELPDSGKSESSYHHRLDEFRRQLLQQALDDASGAVPTAARRLGITRQALSYLIRRLDLATHKKTFGGVRR